MKKFVAILLFILIIISLSACSSKPTKSNNSIKQYMGSGVTFEWRYNPSTGKFGYGPTLNGIGFSEDFY